MKNLLTPVLIMVISICCFTACGAEKEATENTAKKNAVVQNDDYVNGEWHIDSPENHGADKAVLDELCEEIEEQPVNSVLIVKDGSVVFQYYNTGYNEDSIFSFNSCAKSITSALVGIAIDNGFIADVDTKIAEYFPQLNDTGYESKKEITVEHLLNFTSGFNWPEITSPDGIGILADWTKSDNWVDYVLDRRMDSFPGEIFNYNTGNAQLLSAIIQKTSGESAYSFAARQLFEPLGMESVEWHHDPQGVTTGGFIITMTAKDAARFGQLYLNKGRWGDKQIIPDEWVLESTKMHSAGSPYFDEYGYMWWVRSDGYEMFYAMGYAGQFIFVVPELNLVTVFTCDFPGMATSVPISYFENYVITSFK